MAWGTWRGPARRGVSGAIVEGSTLGVFGLVLSGKWGEISEAASYYSSPGPLGTVATGPVAQLPALPPGAVACLPAGATSGEQDPAAWSGRRDSGWGSWAGGCRSRLRVLSSSVAWTLSFASLRVKAAERPRGTEMGSKACATHCGLHAFATKSPWPLRTAFGGFAT